MKQQVRLLLTLLFVSFCAVQSAWADRVAPQLPEAVAPVSGQSYYLYNVLEGKFLCRSTTDTSYPAIGTYGEKITITYEAANEAWTIQFASNNYYWWAYDSYVYTEYYSNSRCYFTISESSRGYTIQRSPKNTDYYKADEFIGYNGNNGDRLNPALAEGSIHWQFMPVEEAEHYFAKHKLYTYLNIADQYNFYVTQYDQVYNNPASTTEELNQAYEVLYDAVTMSSNYVSPEWTEYPIFFQNITENKWKNDEGTLYWYLQYSDGSVQTSRLKATVNVDDNATLVYSYSNDNEYSSLRIFIDDELIQSVTNNQSKGNTRRYYVDLTPGKHDVMWEVVCNDSRIGWYGNSSYLSGIGVVNTPTLYPATTTVEGQLGTEMLKVTDPISKTRKVVIRGVIGDDDWTTIGLMVNAFSIDMSGATAERIPAEQFTKSKYPFLHSVKLPQGIKSIGDGAFYQSDIEEEIIFPNSLETIGRSAFSQSKVKAAYMCESVTFVDEWAFERCYFLENASWSPAAPIIPYACFDQCLNLRTFEIPEGVSEIKERAFRSNVVFNPHFPSTIKRIYYDAFYNTAIEQLIIPENVTVNYHAFGHCNELVYAEWPTSFDYAEGSGSDISTNEVVVECPKLKDVYLKSPTKVLYDYQRFFDGNTLSEITLHVPDYLVSAYKLDPYWYQCNVVGFNSADISEWTVKQPLVLNAGQRIGGTPSLRVINSSRIELNGDDIQVINNLNIEYKPYSGYSFSYDDRDGVHHYYGSDAVYCQLLSNTNNVNITGELSENIITRANEWFFLTLPFDTKVGDLEATALEDGSATSYAIRYYDGASRATNGTGSSWKNYAADDIIPAGTGFIYQTARHAITKFVAQNTPAKQYVLSNNEFVKALEANPSEVTANKGWNLVGNPWQTYYNIHKLNFTAPITVWNNYNERYEAYSIIDDDYAIKPHETFFVQCPDELNSISFPIDGRQLTEEIESQSGAPALNTTDSQRKLIDIELSDGEKGDKTRVVINPQAKMDYETQCDASKFFSMSGDVPQLFTVQNNVEYAINERPADNGVVMLGVLIPADGSYTLQVSRNNLEEAFVYDKQTGTEANLLAGSYSFNAEAGMNTNRFELRLKAGNTTGISLTPTLSQGKGAYYDLNGRRVEQPSKGVYIQNGKKVVIK